MSKHSSRSNKSSQSSRDPLSGLLAQGLSAHQRGQLEEALRVYTRILGQNPNHPSALHYCGVIHLQKGNLKEGIELIRHAVHIHPDPTMRCNLANGMIRLHAYAEALEQLRQAAREDPGNAAIQTNLGIVLANLEQPGEAIEAHRHALKLQPNFPEALNNLGNAQRALKLFEEALSSYDQALALKPGYASALNNRGLALAALQRHDEAITSYDKALEARPAYPEALNNKGSALRARNDFRNAYACFAKALELRPGYAEAHYNRANALAAEDRAEEALSEYDEVLSMTPQNADAHWNKALIQLLLGQLHEGWASYPWRWQITHGEKRRYTDRPLWTGNICLKDQSILVWAEQGMGDTLQFSRHVIQLAEKGARVYFEVQPALVGLLTRNLGQTVQILSRGEACPATDFQCPLLDLPGALDITLETIPSSIPYLSADTARLAQWRKKLVPGKRNVGIVCAGNPRLANDRNRSIPLQDFGPLLTLPDVSFLLLHKECRPGDVQYLEQAPAIQDLREELQDFEDTAALISQLDLVISVDTAVAHLAGALGKAVWLLLPFVPDWRWMRTRTDSPWYPSVHLYRQKTSGDWKTVLEQVRADLSALRSSPSCGSHIQ